MKIDWGVKLKREMAKSTWYFSLLIFNLTFNYSLLLTDDKVFCGHYTLIIFLWRQKLFNWFFYHLILPFAMIGTNFMGYWAKREQFNEIFSKKDYWIGANYQIVAIRYWGHSLNDIWFLVRSMKIGHRLNNKGVIFDIELI